MSKNFLTEQVMVFDEDGKASVIKTTRKREGLNWQVLQLHGLTETTLETYGELVGLYIQAACTEDESEVPKHEAAYQTKLEDLVRRIRDEVEVPADKVLHIAFRPPRLDVVVRPATNGRKKGVTRGTFKVE